ncbi:glycohydrolase toxin TNT-related protein [Promicromonospora sukumoe]|uniref:RHS repeat-associated protein n=1 Tax=Promicromonospora sukumoe TaxID=88382 RepID=A0A7W3PDH3_9MICO|nr:glycohydrolase toxin TNT-related protein [Promicromonospora sukumoe]MBA8807746.1 RHS repeat-associated protein [Promicromonospora sukumoe]
MPDSVYQEPKSQRELPEPREPERPPQESKAGKALAKAEKQIAEQIIAVDDSLTDDRVRAKPVAAPDIKQVTGVEAVRASARMTELDLAAPSDPVAGRNAESGTIKLVSPASAKSTTAPVGAGPTRGAMDGGGASAAPAPVSSEPSDAAAVAADCAPIPGVPYEGRVAIQQMVSPVWNNRDGSYRVRVTNYGTQSWPTGARVGYQVWDSSGNLVPGNYPETSVPLAVGANGGWVEFDAAVRRLAPATWSLTWDIWVPGVGWLTDRGSCATTFELTVVNQPPSFTYRSPASPGTVTTRTPFLTVRGTDPDAWPAGGMEYQFKVCRNAALTTGCSTSQWISQARWQTPYLQWNLQYYWGVQVRDGHATTSGLSTPQSFTVVVPVADDWRRVGNGLGLADVFGVVLPYGVFLHRETDAQLPGGAMPLAVERTFSSGAVGTEGAFGRGWLSLFDARVVRDEVAETMTVTYPDGRQEIFGQDADGQWATNPVYGSATEVVEDTVALEIRVEQSTGELLVYDWFSGRLEEVRVEGAGSWRLSYADGLVSSITQWPSRRSIDVEWDTAYQDCGASVRPTQPYVSSLSVDRGEGQAPATWEYFYVCNRLYRVNDAEGGNTVYTHQGTPTGGSAVFSGTTAAGRALRGLASSGSWQTVPSSFQQRSVVVSEPGSANRKLRLLRPLSGFEGYYRDAYNSFNGVTAMYCTSREIRSSAEYCFDTYDTLEFDVQGRVRVKANRPDGTGSGTGNPRRWLYSATTGRLSAIIDEENNIVEYGYGGWGNLTTSYAYRDPSTQVTSQSYYRPTDQDPDGPPRLTGATVTPTQAGQTVPGSEFVDQYTYDSVGRLIAVDAPTVPGVPDGEQRSYTYTTGTETAVTSGGSQTAGKKMPAGLLRTETTAAGTTSYGYNEAGDLTWTREAGGGRVGRDYDAAGYMIREVVNGEAEITYTRDRLGRVTRELEGYTYPWLGDLDEQGVRVVDREYDADGLVTGVTERAVAFNPHTGIIDWDTDVLPPRASQYEYTPQGRLSEVTDSGGGVTVYTYSASNPDQVASTTDARGRRTLYSYDIRGRLSVVRADVGPPGQTSRVEIARYSYNLAGQLSSELDALQRPTYYEYTLGGTFHGYTGDGYPTTALRPSVVIDGEDQPVTLWDREYDGAGNVIRETVGGQRTTEYEYDAMSRLVSTTLDPGGLDRMVTTKRDAAGREIGTELTDGTRTERHTQDLNAAGYVVADHAWLDDDTALTTQYERDVWGNAVRVVDPRGVANPTQAAKYTSHAFADPHGRVVETTGFEVTVDTPTSTTGSGAYTAFTQSTRRSQDTIAHDPFGQVSLVQAANGQTTRYEYDTAGRVAAEHQPAYQTPGGETIEPVTRYEYNPAGDLARMTDPRGGVTDYAYDVSGNLVREQGPVVDGQRPTTTYTYDVANQLTSTTSPSGVRTSFGYDALGRMVAQTVAVRTDSSDPDSPTTNHITSYAYDAVGNLTATTSPQGRTTRYEHNAAGEITAVHNPGRTEPVRYTYDLAGRVTSTTDGADRGVEHVYDLAGRRTSSTQVGSSGGRLTTAFEYDEASNLVAVTDPRGTTTTSTVDPAGRTTKISQPISSTEEIDVEVGYDIADNPVRIRNGEGNDTWTTYNSWGLPEKVIEPPTPRDPALTDRSWTTTYDAGGNPVSLTKPGGVVVTTAYDALSRVRSLEAGGPYGDEDAQFAYDLESRLAEATNGPTGKVALAWDDLGRLTESEGPGGSSHRFGYDADGLLTSDAASNTAIGTTTYERDDAGDVTRTTNQSTRGTQAWTSHYADATGDLQLRGLPGGMRTDWAYDQYGRTRDITTSNSLHDVVHTISYEYDANGNVASKRSSEGISFGGEYAYDLANRLTTFAPRAADGTTGQDPEHTYDWDDAGNRLAETVGTTAREWEYDDRNRLVDLTTTDGAQPVVTPIDVDPRGNITNIGDRALEYDHLDQLTTDSTATGATFNSYDATGRLAYAQDAAIGGGTFDYAGLSADPAAVSNVRLGGISRSEVVTRNADGQILASATASAAGAYATRTALTDAHTDMTGALALSGSAAGQHVARVGYDPFGQRWTGSATPGSVTHPASMFGFQSDWTNPATGAVNMGARWYDPALGTFLSRDSTSLPPTSTDAVNRYTYAGGNPTTFFDPTGRFLKLPDLFGDVSTGLDNMVDDAYKNLDNVTKSAGNHLSDAGQYARNAGRALNSPAGRAITKIAGRVGLKLIPGLGWISLAADAYMLYDWATTQGRPHVAPGAGRTPTSGNLRTETGSVSVTSPQADPPPPPAPTITHVKTWTNLENKSSDVTLSNVGGMRVVTTTWMADKYRYTQNIWSNGHWDDWVRTFLGHYTIDVIKEQLGKVVDPTRVDASHTTPTQTAQVKTSAQAADDGQCGLSGTLLSCMLALPTVTTGCAPWDAPLRLCTAIAATPGAPGSTGPATGSDATGTTPTPVAPQPEGAGTGGSDGSKPPTSSPACEPDADSASEESRSLAEYWPPNRGALGETTREFLYAGTRIDRYGHPFGRFVAPAGTPYAMRALPPGSSSKPLTTYEVLKPFEVQSSQAAPAFCELGLGTQYELPTSVDKLVVKGILREVK